METNQEINNDQAIAQLTGQETPEYTQTEGATGTQEGETQRVAGETQTAVGTTQPKEDETQQTKSETQTQFDIESLNTFLEIPENKRFKSADDFKSYYTDMGNRWDQFKDLERVKKELKEGQEALELHNQEIEKLYEDANPEKIFGSKDAYKNYLIKQEITKDGMKNGAIVDVILNSDINTLDEFDLIIAQKQLNTPGLDEEEAIYDLIYYDLRKTEADLQDEDGNDLPFDSKADLFKILKPHEIGKLKTMANLAKKELLSIKNTDVQADDNYFTSHQSKREADKQAKEDRINQIKESWKPVYDSFNDIKSVQLTEKDKEGNENVIFDFPIDSGVLSKINKSVEDYVISHNIEPTDENIQQVRSEFIDGYAKNNWEKLVRAALTQSVQQVKEDNMKERENHQPIKTTINSEQGLPDIAKKNEEELRKHGIIP